MPKPQRTRPSRPFRPSANPSAPAASAAPVGEGGKKRPDSHARRPGGRSGGRPPPRGKKGPAKVALVPTPDILWGKVEHIGAQAVARIFHKELNQLNVVIEDTNPPEDGEIVQLKIGKQDKYGRATGHVVSRHGQNPAGLASFIACTNFGLDLALPENVIDAANALPSYVWDDKEGREDWRKLPFVTIDGEDARDYDDAVCVGEEAEDGTTEVRVAIADVSHYVQPGSVLDREAVARGNSTYFPDRVLPMLPEHLSNNLCSLVPAEDRPVLGVVMKIDSRGKLVSKKFARATIHSHARLTYTEVQEVLDDEKSSHKMTNEIKLLYKVFEKLLKARINRGSLDLDIGEAKINLGEDGKIASITERPRRDAERLIEELMITANVAAAQVFSTKGLGVYRVHDTPTKEKVDTLRSTLGPMGFTVPSPEAGHRAWAKLVEELKKHPAGPQLMRAVLQTQQQAKYDAQNIGHYGLALPLYSHFTSPIRRYADLLVHRAIIKHLSLPGQGGHLAEGGAVLTRVCEGINLRERISQRAEWEAKDRLIVQYFSELLIKAEEEQIFDATVTGVQKYGMFISINGVAEGLLPVESLRENGYDYVPRFELYKKGQDKKKILRLASTVKVELADADQIRGRLTFRLISA